MYSFVFNDHLRHNVKHNLNYHNSLKDFATTSLFTIGALCFADFQFLISPGNPYYLIILIYFIQLSFFRASQSSPPTLLLLLCLPNPSQMPQNYLIISFTKDIIFITPVIDQISLFFCLHQHPLVHYHLMACMQFSVFYF